MNELDELKSKVNDFEAVYLETLKTKDDKKLKARLNTLAIDIANIACEISEKV